MKSHLSLLSLRSLFSRLKEPGSLRSLVLLLFILRGQAVDDATITSIVDSAMVILAAASFLMPGDAPVGAVTKAAEHLTDASKALASVVPEMVQEITRAEINRQLGG